MSEICTKEWFYHAKMPLSDECSVSAEITGRSGTNYKIKCLQLLSRVL